MTLPEQRNGLSEPNFMWLLERTHGGQVREQILDTPLSRNTLIPHDPDEIPKFLINFGWRRYRVGDLGAQELAVGRL